MHSIYSEPLKNTAKRSLASLEYRTPQISRLAAPRLRFCGAGFSFSTRVVLESPLGHSVANPPPACKQRADEGHSQYRTGPMAQAKRSGWFLFRFIRNKIPNVLFLDDRVHGAIVPDGLAAQFMACLE